ncbi:MAG: quaternary ammonium compound efflux SMR transporter SugE [Verrucomicrobia bacterium]|nr:quaternary ammonium compound efflux SMR transporter SugE [Verrucomicrobiota bacterium]MBU6447050.1 quaternary ammonium compound efflux SMR transporter SugE [Verrucomicrobiota bacterium]MDE3046876.1 quaternary ammonium compound efflux SMR transporter SugE [Verrucomicrobiota bacterium]
MNWLALMIAGLFEIVWAVSLKYTQGFTKFTPSLVNIAAMILSILLLSYSFRTIPVSTGYAIWTGIGACGTLLFGMFVLGESRDPLRIVCILVIIACIFILKMTHKSVNS